MTVIYGTDKSEWLGYGDGGLRLNRPSVTDGVDEVHALVGNDRIAGSLGTGDMIYGHEGTIGSINDSDTIDYGWYSGPGRMWRIHASGLDHVRFDVDLMRTNYRNHEWTTYKYSGNELVGWDHLSHIVNVVGNMQDDVIKGDRFDNELLGGSGDDLLDGRWGNDILVGYSGFSSYYSTGDNDTLIGGYGDDRLYGGPMLDTLIPGPGNDYVDGGADVYMRGLVGGMDTVSYELSYPDTTYVEVDLTRGFATEHWEINGAPYTTRDRLIDVENVRGTETVNYGDSLFGNHLSNLLVGLAGNDYLMGRGGADTLWGGVGNDTLEGGSGSDTLDGGSGNDTVSYALNGNRVDVNLSTQIGTEYGQIMWVLWPVSTDDLISIENVTGSRYADKITGDAGDNILDGGTGEDTLNGEGGKDILRGGVGSDILNGGGNHDLLEGGGLGPAEVDSLTGGEGYDVFKLVHSNLGSQSIPCYAQDGDRGFAIIEDFAVGDTIYLYGSANNYRVDAFLDHTRLFYTAGQGDDLVALVRGNYGNLSLDNLSQFRYM